MTASPSALLASLLLAGTAASAATDYPTQPITVLVPHAAGGPTDTVARLVAESMTQHAWASSCSSRTPAAPAAPWARRAPPGPSQTATPCCSTTSPRLHSATLYRKLSYDPDGAFDGIGRITDVPMTIVARADFEAEHHRRADRVHPRQQGHRHLRPCRRRLGIAPVRHAVHGCDRRAADHRPLQGHRPGDDRPPGRPGRRDVRPDHQHREPDQDRQDQGLRGDHQGPAGGAARSAHPRRVWASRASR